MKSSILFIFLFLCFGVEAGQGSPEVSDSVFQVEVQNYGKSFVYQYFVEPLISLDEQLESIISHCSILEEDLSQKVRTYDGVGSCLFEQMNIFSPKEESRRNIVFHVDSLFNLLFQWEGFSVQGIFRSYRQKGPHGLSGEITFHLMSDEESISDHLSYLLSALLQPSESEDLINIISSLMLKHKISAVLLKSAPYEDRLLKIELSFMDSNNSKIHTLEVVTNYYPGSDEYFVASMDHYQEELDED